MTDKIKKLEQLTEDVQPEFPALPRGGYVEDTVDDWLSNHLKEVNDIIKYQNYGVEVVESLEEELGQVTEQLAQANEQLEQTAARLHQFENDALVVEAGANSTDELAALRAELTKANARIHELENNPIGEFPSGESETVQASILLQHATTLGAQYIAQAKADGEQIRKDAEATLVELREEIENLEAQRFATFRSLDDFFSQELANLRANNVFAVEAQAPVEDEAPLADEEEEVAAEVETVKAKGGKNAAKTVAVDEEEVLPLDEKADDEENELETLEIVEKDEESEGTSK